MASNFKITYGVDLVFCIDATRSMEMENVLEAVKNNALNFYQDFKRKMDSKNKPVAQLRVRIVAFRDYLADKDEAMLVTKFFHLPEDAEDFRACVQSIEGMGGGDDPEDGLEALAYAIKSEWDMQSIKRRHVIVVWSDEGTHELGYGKKAANYPQGMAKDFEELSSWWGTESHPGKMDESAKRLVLFTPDKPGWNKISSNWNNVVQYSSEAGKGLSALDYEQILNVISNTI